MAVPASPLGIHICDEMVEVLLKGSQSAQRVWMTVKHRRKRKRHSILQNHNFGGEGRKQLIL